MIERCGCGREAEFAVYEHGEPHCVKCLKEAASVGKVEVEYVWDWSVKQNGQVNKCNK